MPGKLGKLAPRHDPRTLRLADYITHKLPPLPEEFKAWPVGKYGQMLNQEIGDCTCAAAGHMIQNWTGMALGKATTVTDEDVLVLYEMASGYDPTTGENDNGAVELDVLRLWRNTGLGGHRIWGWCDMEPRNHEHLKAAIFLFGGAYLGIAMPEAWQNAKVWAVPPCGLTGHGEPGSWGGHAVCAIAYNKLGPIVVTWGDLVQMTWGAFDAYVDEAHAVVSEDWLHTYGVSPTGLNLTQMQADLKALAK